MGLESPNFELYHLANEFKYFIEWLKFSQHETAWSGIKQELGKDLHLLDLPVITQSVKKHKCFQSMTIASTLIAWCNAHQSAHSVVLPSLQAPIWNK